MYIYIYIYLISDIYTLYIICEAIKYNDNSTEGGDTQVGIWDIRGKKVGIWEIGGKKSWDIGDWG